MSDPSLYWISATRPRQALLASVATERNVTLSSTRASVSRRRTWKPPESVRIGPPSR
jgi:hypothetical protein